MEPADSDIISGWIKKYSDIFFNYTYKRVAVKSVVNDILQETFIAAWKNISSFKKKADEKTWLFAILKNKLIDHYRLQAKLAIEPLNSDNYLMMLSIGQKVPDLAPGKMLMKHLITKSFIPL